MTIVRDPARDAALLAGALTVDSAVVLDDVALETMTAPWGGARLAAELATHLRQRSAVALEVRREAVRELVLKLCNAQRHVAENPGLIPTRINQLLAADRPSITAVA